MHRLSRRKRLLHFILWAPYWITEFRTWLVCWVRKYMGDSGNRVRRLRGILGRMTTQPLLKELPKLQAWAETGLPREHVLMGFRYRPKLIHPIRIDLIRETYEFTDRAHPLRPFSQSHKFDAGWNEWAGYPPNIIWIESNHDDIVTYPIVKKLAAKIRSAMDRFILS